MTCCIYKEYEVKRKKNGIGAMTTATNVVFPEFYYEVFVKTVIQWGRNEPLIGGGVYSGKYFQVGGNEQIFSCWGGGVVYPHLPWRENHVNYYLKKQYYRRALLGSMVRKLFSLSFNILVFHIDKAMSKNRKLRSWNF